MSVDVGEVDVGLPESSRSETAETPYQMLGMVSVSQELVELEERETQSMPSSTCGGVMRKLKEPNKH